jgi:deoxyribose-phosphate aldolase
MADELPTVAEIAGLIDHAILRPDATLRDVDAGCTEAAAYGVFSVCARPNDVRHAVAALAGSGVEVGTVIGFPHGSTSTGAKVAEALAALDDGATELDMVLQIGRLRGGRLDDVESDISAVVRAAGAAPVKVILETALLAADEIVAGCRVAEQAGAAFVKTSTGFGGRGASDDDIRLMRGAVGPQVQVKASGGIRDLDTLLRFRALGATRIGTSATAVILDDLEARS